ncbi:MAG: UvrB/UvrC motif-containing protein [Solirubrobacteraceae bacterium]
MERELGRPPDSGDLLLALASAPETRAAAALAALGVPLDGLAAAVERARAESGPSEDDLSRQLAQARDGKQRAADSQEFETAAELRDEERRLVAALTEAAVPPAVIAAIRARLGLSPADADHASR